MNEYWEYITFNDLVSVSLLSSAFHELTIPIKEKYFLFRYSLFISFTNVFNLFFCIFFLYIYSFDNLCFSIPRGSRARLFSPQLVVVGNKRSIPNHPKCLILDRSFNESIEVIQKEKKKIEGKGRRGGEKEVFNSSLTLLFQDLPSSLCRLIFQIENTFNFPADHLPPSLTHVFFGSKFNQSVDNFPPSISYLQFGGIISSPLLSPSLPIYLLISSPSLLSLSFIYTSRSYSF